MFYEALCAKIGGMADDVKIAYEQAIDLFAGGRVEDAQDALLALISINPQYADAYETLGMIYYKVGSLDQAILHTEKLAALRPDYAMAHTNLSIFYMKKGLKDKAEEEKAKATVLNFSKPKGQ